MAKVPSKPVVPAVHTAPIYDRIFFYGEIKLGEAMTEEDILAQAEQLRREINTGYPDDLVTVQASPIKHRHYKGPEAVLVTRTTYGVQGDERVDMAQVKNDVERAVEELNQQGATSHVQITIPPVIETLKENWI